MIEFKRIKMIATDLDGTLLNAEGELDNLTSEVLQQLKPSHVAAVTSRGLRTIPDSVLNHDKIRYVIASNGAVTYDTHNRAIISSFGLNPGRVLELIDRLSEANGIISLLVDGRIYSSTDVERSVAHLDKEQGQQVLDRIRATRTILDDDQLKSFITKQDFIEQLHYSFLNPDDKRRANAILFDYVQQQVIALTSSHHTNLEITHPRATKGDAIATLSRELGLALDDILAIGDSDNDLSMLGVTLNSVAMKNANPNVKRDAAMETEFSHDTYGWARFMQRYLVE